MKYAAVMPLKGYFDSEEVRAEHSFCNKNASLIKKKSVSYKETANYLDSTLTEYATSVRMQQ